MSIVISVCLAVADDDEDDDEDYTKDTKAMMTQTVGVSVARLQTLEKFEGKKASASFYEKLNISSTHATVASV